MVVLTSGGMTYPTPPTSSSFTIVRSSSWLMICSVYIECYHSQMRSNYVNVKRAMAACDRHEDGFISLPDLRAVLSAFTIPMSEQLFHQLMER